MDSDMDGEIEADIQQTVSGTKTPICQDCRNIDFSLAMTQNLPLRELDWLEDWPRSSFVSNLDHFSTNCALCLQFHAAKLTFGGVSDSSYDLRAFCLPISYHSSGQSTVLSPPRTAWIQPVPREIDKSRLLGYWSEIAPQGGWTACHLTTDDPCVFRPQPIRARLDGVLVKAWLSACKRAHGTSCNASQNISGLVLIDCVTLQLRHASKQDEYVALSYVWGKAGPGSMTDPVSSANDGKLQLPPVDRLSQVIKDAISVTKSLHFRYLWVDKYCINQHDASVKEYQIDNMDLIYKGAELTIIAAAGDDEHHGLSGVSTERYQRVVVMDKFAFFNMPAEPFWTARTAPWAKRAWVRQSHAGR
jgi:hypothetical protein